VRERNSENLVPEVIGNKARTVTCALFHKQAFIAENVPFVKHLTPHDIQRVADFLKIFEQAQVLAVFFEEPRPALNRDVQGPDTAVITRRNCFSRKNLHIRAKFQQCV
jgi:hypothetical protein